MGQGVDQTIPPAIARSVSPLESENSAECFSRAFHSSPYVQTVTRFDSGRYLYVNDSFVKAAGFARNEVIGKTSIEIGILADKPDRSWLTEALRQRGRLSSEEVRFRIRSGDIRLGLLNAQVITLDGGDCILSTVRDITEQLAAEERYRQQSCALDLVHEAVIILDPQGRITYWNQAAQQLYGWTSAEVIGQVARTLLFSNSNVSFNAAWRASHLKKEWRGEIAQCTKAGTELLVESRWFALYEKLASRMASLLIVSTNISGRDMTADLFGAAGLARVERLAAELAHEIENPLAGIKGVVDTFLSRGRLTSGHVARSRTHDSVRDCNEASFYPSQSKRGRPQRQTTAPLGNLILTAMKLLGLSYKDIVRESERLAQLNDNSGMRIAKSTLGNVISGSIRQPGPAKLDSLRIILNLARADIDAAIGLQPERRFVEQLEMTRMRTHEVPIDAVIRHRKLMMPILRDDANLQETQFLGGALNHWESIEAEYFGSFYPPHLCYVVVGEEDTNASPVAPPGSRLLVNKLFRQVRPPENASYHERELFCVMTPQVMTCGYLEYAPGEKIVLIPHPLSNNVREEFRREEVKIIGQVVGVLYPP